MADRLAGQQGDDDADKLVARVGDQIEQLALVADRQEVAAELEREDLGHDDQEGRRGRHAEQLWVEGPAQAGQQCRQQNVGDQGHD